MGIKGQSPRLALGFPCDKVFCMNTVTLSEARQNLVELVQDLARQGEWLITDQDRPVARLVPVTAEMTGRASLRDIKPASVGAILQPFPSPDDDTLGEMLDTRP